MNKHEIDAIFNDNFDPANNKLDNMLMDFVYYYGGDTSTESMKQFKIKIVNFLKSELNPLNNNLSMKNDRLHGIKKSVKNLKNSVDDIPSKKKIRKLIEDENKKSEKRLANYIGLLASSIVAKYLINSKNATPIEAIVNKSKVQTEIEKINEIFGYSKNIPTNDSTDDIQPTIEV